MKNSIIVLYILLISFIVNAQEKEEKYPQDINKKHEVKINVSNLIIFSSLDATYERLLSKDASFGVSFFYNFNDVNSDIYFPKKFSLTPYYRWFFTESRYARGFFVEGFGMLNTYEDEVFYFSDGNTQTKKETDFALGVSVGGKFIIKSGFTAEIYLGVGRNLFNKNDNFIDNEIVTRGGISLGYRF